jgi:choline-sulfatase
VRGWHAETEVDKDPQGGYARYFPPDPAVSGTPDSVRLPGGPHVIIGGTYPRGEKTPTTELTDLALGWLRAGSSSEAPWFTHVSYVAPHTPVLAPAEFRSMFDDGDFAEPPNGFTGAGLSAYERSVSSIQSSDMLTRDEVAAARASYWACVAHLDNEIGQLIEELETLGLRENTVVIVDADHGTMLGEHGMWQKHVFNRASHRVPLIISAPGHLDPCRRSDINEILDRIRTVQGLVGIAPRSDIGGRDLFRDPAPAYVFGAIGSGEAGSMLYPLVGGQDEAPQRLCVRSDRYRLDLSTRFRGQDIAPDSDTADIFVADVAADRLEQRNAAAEIPLAALDELLGALWAWRSACARRSQEIGDWSIGDERG